MVQRTLMMTTHATIFVVQKKTQPYAEWTLSNDSIPLAIKRYGCLHSHFDSFFIAYAQTTIMCHQQSSLVPSKFISYYWQCVCIALQHAQAITILQWVVALGRGSSSFPHIIIHAPLLLADLWIKSFFILGFFCYRLLSFRSHESFWHRFFTWFLLIVYFCFFFRLCIFAFYLPCTFVGWVPILDFYLQGFSFIWAWFLSLNLTQCMSGL
jgi:hypothetical protein